MNHQLKHAAIDTCTTQCTMEIYRLLRLLGVNSDKVLIRYDVEKILKEYLKNAN